MTKLNVRGLCVVAALLVALDLRAVGPLQTRVGIVSDLHIANEGDSEVTLFREALEHFRERGVDAVVCGGDMANGGKYEQMELVRRIWDGVFPDGKGKDGRSVGRIFIYGNHDVSSWGGHAGPTGIHHDPAANWKRCWHEDWAPVYLKRINGIAFIGVHWGHEGELAGFLEAHADELRGGNPFFVVQHPHPKNTCHGSFAGGQDEGLSAAALAAFPNAVVLSGHSHRTLTDEMAFWQGSFTSVGMGSLSYTALPRHRHMPFGYENTTIVEVKGDRMVEGSKMMPFAPTQGHPFMVMTVNGPEVSFERLELADGRVLSLGRDWQVVTPVGKDRPMSFAGRQKKEVPPAFPSGFVPAVERRRLPTRGYRGFNGWTIDDPVSSKLKDAFAFDVPQTVGPDRTFELEIAIETKGGVTDRRYALVAGYDRSPDSPEARKPTRVILSCDQMPRQTFRYVVTPVTSLGTRGHAVSSDWIPQADDVAYPPAPGRESWAFRDELAKPAAEVRGVKPETRVPWLRHRISRCYFSPIKRPPFNRDELADDVDYYPEPYLKRLQSERINGLWITVEFGDLVGDAKRLSKLRATVERCARYGIRVWLFAIEPKAVAKDDPRFRESPDLFPCSNPWDSGRRLWCASDPRTLAYLHDSVRDVFRAVPGLGGLLSITHGERCCSCFSRCDALDDGVRTPCPVCAKKEPWQLHHALADALVRGMREANPSAELLSWFYMPYASPHRAHWVAEAAKHLPDGVTLLVNFESGIVREQLGRSHVGGDYWLSVAGPSGPFAEVAAAARSAGMPFGAKIQVGCSHEDATLPFVPVPGLLYRKYKAMREAGCSSVLQCWYFGNYPGLMNKAAGELAFSDFSESEGEFLLRLARDDWGEHAAEVAAIWEALTEAYSDYPLSNTVQYFGPFHAGVVWPLEPDLELNPLMPTWVCKPDPSGDAVGECLGDHTLAEALELSRRMSARCAGLAPRLEALAKAYAGDHERLKDIGVMQALILQFAAAHDIFDFYAARAEAVRASRVAGDAAAAVRAADRMAAAVRRERAVTEAMLPICRADSRIGFHSEAEAHQFFPARLEWRLATLDRARGRLDEISRELAAGQPYPLSDWERTAPTCLLDGSWTEGKGLRFRLTPVAGGQVRLEAEADADGDFIVCAYDAAGTVFPQERIVRMKGRKGELTLPLAADDRLLVFGRERPMVWPHPGEDLPYRLSIGHAWARSCGRCVKKGKGNPR